MIMKGIPASAGATAGKAVVPEGRTVSVPHRHFPPSRTTEYLQRFENAREAVRREIGELLVNTAEGSAEKALLTAHAAILDDVEFLSEIRASITKRYRIPEYAVDCACEYYASILEGSGTYAEERIQDIRDVRDRLVIKIRHEADLKAVALGEDSILVCAFLRPSEAAGMEREHVLGVVTEKGGMTSHVAILLRSYGIPAVMGVEHAAERIRTGDVIALNGTSGEVLCGANDSELAAFMEKEDENTETASNSTRSDEVCSATPTFTKDGTRILLGVNAGQIDCSTVFRCGENCGLFRTEFLLMSRGRMMDEEEQTAFYARILRDAQGKTVTLRTFDFKGDKSIPGLDPESREMYRVQMRAMLRAGVSGNMRMLFPMVRNVKDIRDIREAIDAMRKNLLQEGKACAMNVPLGVMIEIPALAEDAEEAAKIVDFASIGTNDLVSFMLGEDREAAVERELLPASAVKVIRRVADAFLHAGKPLSVCGEAAGQPETAKILLESGIRELSMEPVFLPAVKRMIEDLEL